MVRHPSSRHRSRSCGDPVQGLLETTGRRIQARLSNWPGALLLQFQAASCEYRTERAATLRLSLRPRAARSAVGSEDLAPYARGGKPFRINISWRLAARLGWSDVTFRSFVCPRARRPADR